MGLRKVKVNNALILREDGKLFKIDTKEEFIPSKGSWTGYRINIRENGKQTLKYVHQLVLMHFGPSCPGADYRIQHINGDKYDNRLKNLRWATRSEINRNRKDALPVGQRRCDFDDEDAYQCSLTKRWQARNPDKVKAYRKRRSLLGLRKRNKETDKRCNKNWREKNPEKYKAIRKKCDNEHKVERSLSKKIWAIEHS